MNRRCAKPNTTAPDRRSQPRNRDTPSKTHDPRQIRARQRARYAADECEWARLFSREIQVSGTRHRGWLQA